MAYSPRKRSRKRKRRAKKHKPSVAIVKSKSSGQTGHRKGLAQSTKCSQRNDHLTNPFCPCSLSSRSSLQKNLSPKWVPHSIRRRTNISHSYASKLCPMLSVVLIEFSLLYPSNLIWKRNDQLLKERFQNNSTFLLSLLHESYVRKTSHSPLCSMFLPCIRTKSQRNL